MTIKETIKKYSQELKEVTHIPAKEVEILIMFLLEKNVIWMHLNGNMEFKKEEKLKALVKKRSTHFPLEYLTNRVSFYGETFIIKQNVLIPRPETEILVEKAFEKLKQIENPKVVEIGTGSGIISVMLSKLLPQLKVTAVDINDDALELAKENAKKHSVENQISFIKSDLLKEVSGDFDMCISNPPYISNNYVLPHNVKYEPKNALFGGEIGDELLKDLIEEVTSKNIKYLYCEYGYDQRESINNYMKKFNVKSLEFYKDYSDFDRGFLIEFNTK
ncbi:peptide chain release factor N(5)-glutamine methyltransferase [Arcobacter sp.]|uniref:peptide chain release factor N(5)-glutamine methyltransferase n=1 Tax=unclassified Arcobacter TaxID=2593671 RepID=UPI003B0096A3